MLIKFNSLLFPVVTNEKQRKLIYNMELEQISETAQALMQAASHVDAQFTQAVHLEHVRPMFRVSFLKLLNLFQEVEKKIYFLFFIIRSRGHRFWPRSASISRTVTTRRLQLCACKASVVLSALLASSTWR
jgi:hypothetical protein